MIRRFFNSPWSAIGAGLILGAAVTFLPEPPRPPSQLDRIESTLDQTVDFLSDLHAERSACR